MNEVHDILLYRGDTYSLDEANLIKPDGEIKGLTPAKKSFTYNEIRDAINPNCLIQPIQLRYWTKNKVYKKMNFICDEEGIINGSAYNEKATLFLRKILGPNAQNLYGNIIFLPNKLFRL